MHKEGQFGEWFKADENRQLNKTINERSEQQKGKRKDKANGAADSQIVQRSTNSLEVGTMTNSTRDGEGLHIRERHQSNQLQKVSRGENVEVERRKGPSEVGKRKGKVRSGENLNMYDGKEQSDQTRDR